MLKVLLLIRFLLVRQRRNRTLIIRSRSLTHKRHRPIPLEIRHRHHRRIHRQLLIIRPKTMSMRIGVREQPRLQDRIGGGFDTGDEMRGRERGLFDLREVVLRVLVQDDLPHRTEGELGVWPDFGEVEDIVAELFGLLGSHGLDVDRPGGVFLGLDGFEEFLGAVVRVGAAEGAGGVVVEGLEAFIMADVDLDVDPVTRGVDPFEGVAGVTGD